MKILLAYSIKFLFKTLNRVSGFFNSALLVSGVTLSVCCPHLFTDLLLGRNRRQSWRRHRRRVRNIDGIVIMTRTPSYREREDGKEEFLGPAHSVPVLVGHWLNRQLTRLPPPPILHIERQRRVPGSAA